VKLPPTSFAKVEKRTAFVDGVLETLRSQAGVAQAGFVSAMPFTGEHWIEMPRRAGQKTGPTANARWVSPGYLETTGQRLVAGRFLEDRDRGKNSIVLTEGLARALWGGENPLGDRVNLLGGDYEVVGIAGDSRSTSAKEAPAKIAYVHYANRMQQTAFFAVQGPGGADVLLRALRDSIQKHAPAVALTRVNTMEAQLADSLAQECFRTALLVGFGGAALALAMLGIYGVLSYTMAMRKREIGVRMALGASRRDVYTFAMGGVAWPVAGGLCGGFALSVFGANVLEKSLYGTKPVDPLVTITVITLFALFSGLAAFLPTRRAAMVPPMEALRPE
jgi:hypothetical protein